MPLFYHTVNHRHDGVWDNCIILNRVKLLNYKTVGKPSNPKPYIGKKTSSIYGRRVSQQQSELNDDSTKSCDSIFSPFFSGDAAVDNWIMLC